jgi:hypothetical protein
MAIVTCPECEVIYHDDVHTDECPHPPIVAIEKTTNEVPPPPTVGARPVAVSDWIPRDEIADPNVAEGE